MRARDIIRKLRMWGLRGAFNYMKARLEHRRWHRFFAANTTGAKPQEPLGLTVVGDLTSQGSTNKVLRDLCHSLKDTGIPFQTFDFGNHEIPEDDVREILTPRTEFRINRYPCLVEMLASPIQDGLVRQRGHIVFWEFESGVLEAYPTLVEHKGDVLAMSDFNFTYLNRELAGKRHVQKILYPLRIDLGHLAPKEVCRKRFGFNDNEFIVFYNFSYASGWNRKNPLGVLEAFCRAFRDRPDARLVFKTAGRRNHEDRVLQLLTVAREKGIADRLTFVDDYLLQDDLYNLTNACDVYLSLHRSEGFGLGIAEAMMMGKAVVVTGYSAPMEFCNAENAVIVPFRMIPVDCSDVKWYAAAKEWVEPDVDAAAEALKQLYRDAAHRDALGRQAAADIRERFSLDRFRASMLAYLKNH